MLIEAMASGLPAIASAIDGNTELVRHMENGLLFPSEDIQALTNAMQRLISDTEMTARIRSVLPHYVKQFDWPMVSEKYRDLYATLVDTPLNI